MFQSDQIDFLAVEGRNGESWCPQILKRLGIKTFMSHFQSFAQISKMLIEICVLLEDQFKRARGGGGGRGRRTENS